MSPPTSKHAMNLPSQSPAPSSFPAHLHVPAARSSCRKDRPTLPIRVTIIALCGMLWIPSTSAQSASISGSSGATMQSAAIASFVSQASRKFGLPASWIDAVIAVESGGQAGIVSSKGAMGLMQIMPQTWAALRAQYSLGDNPFDTRDNIMAGTAYLRRMFDRYGIGGFLAAYNVGPSRYEDYLVAGRPLPAETQSYLAKLASRIGDRQVANLVLAVNDSSVWTHSPLFAGHAIGVFSGTNTSVPPTINSPSTRRQTGHAVVEISALAPQSNGLFALSSASGRLP